MADGSLDYGEPDVAEQSRQSRFEDERAEEDPSMTVDSGWDDELPSQQQSDSTTSGNQRNQPRMYRFPDGLAVAAGANRGPSPAAQELPIIDDIEEQGDPPATPVPIGGGADVRLTALNLNGPPIAALSTSRLFAYVSHFGAQPLGVEWINDTSVNIVFADSAAARLALEYICPADVVPPLPSAQHIEEATAAVVAATQGFDAAPWPQEFLDLCITPRKAHRFPQKLYNAVERDTLLRRADELRKPTEEQPASSQYPDSAPAIYREFEQQDRDAKAKASEADATLRDIRRLLALIWARYAVESVDVKHRDARQKSAWYKEHGKDAGKEVVPKLLEVGELKQARELLPDPNASDSLARASADETTMTALGASRDLPPHLAMQSKQRHGNDLMRFGSRRSASPITERRGGGGGGGTSGHGESSYRGRGNRYANQKSREELDAEMDNYSYVRDSASPELRASRATNDSNFAPPPPLPGPSVGGGSGVGGGSYMAQWDDDVGMASVSGSGTDGGGASSNKPKIRGRGRHKAPSSGGLAGWGNDEDSGSGRNSNNNSSNSRRRGRGNAAGGGAMYADEEQQEDGTDEFGRSARLRGSRGGAGRNKGRGRGGGWDDREYETAAQDSGSLAQRLGGAPGELTLQQRLGTAKDAGSSNSLQGRLSSWD